jgi:hypothetical protein
MKRYTDQEVEKLSSPFSQKKRYSDEEVNHLEYHDKTPELMSALEHFGNSATLGYLPNIQAAVEPLTNRIYSGISGQNIEEDKNYVQRREENKKRLQNQEKEYPEASFAGTLAGSIVPSVPLLGATNKIKAMSNLARSKAVSNRIAHAMAVGGIQSSLMNPGENEDEISGPQLNERASNAAIGAALSGPLHYIAEKFPQVRNKVSSYIKDKSERLAFRALGPFKRQVNQNSHRINDIGRTALDEGIISFPPRNAENIEKSAKSARLLAGQKLGEIIDDLAELESHAIKSGADLKDIGKELRERLIKKSDIPSVNKMNEFYKELISEFEEGQSFNFKKLVQEKRNVKDLINWNRLKEADIPILEKFHRALYASLKKAEESGAKAIAEAYPQAESSQSFQPAKKLYGELKEAQKIAKNRADAQRANQIMGLKSAVYGAAGAGLGGTIGHKIGGLPGAIGGSIIGGKIGSISNYLAKNYGSQFSAYILDQAAKLLEQSPNLLETIKQNPGFIPYLLQAIDKENKQ